MAVTDLDWSVNSNVQLKVIHLTNVMGTCSAYEIPMDALVTSE